MKNTFGFIAIMGVLSAMCGIVTDITAIVTVVCGILYLFYPTTNTNRYEED